MSAKTDEADMAFRLYAALRDVERLTEAARKYHPEVGYYERKANDAALDAADFKHLLGQLVSAVVRAHLTPKQLSAVCHKNGRSLDSILREAETRSEVFR